MISTYFSLYKCSTPLVTSTRGFPQKKLMVSSSSDTLLSGGDRRELVGRMPVSVLGPVRTLAYVSTVMVFDSRAPRSLFFCSLAASVDNCIFMYLFLSASLTLLVDFISINITEIIQHFYSQT